MEHNGWEDEQELPCRLKAWPLGFDRSPVATGRQKLQIRKQNLLPKSISRKAVHFLRLPFGTKLRLSTKPAPAAPACIADYIYPKHKSFLPAGDQSLHCDHDCVPSLHLVRGMQRQKELDAVLLLFEVPCTPT